MANFGQLTGSKTARANKRAAKLESRIRQKIEARDSDPIELSPVVDATARFLSSFGADTVRLNRTSTKALTRMDTTQQNKMKERAIAEVVAVTRRELSSALDRYARGRIDEQGLRSALQQTIRRQALASAVIGVGGVGNITENTILAVQRSISNSFRLLDGFIADIAAREVTPRDYARLAQYANAAHNLSQTAQRQFRLDMLGGDGANDLEERRVLGGAEHCDDCIALAGLGWVDAGELPPIGQETVCGNSCRCSIETRVRQVSGTYEPNAGDGERLR